MTRRATLTEMIYPDTPDSAELAMQWAQSATSEILDLIWRGFDAFRANHLSRVNSAQLRASEQPERSLVDLHFQEILLLWKAKTDGYSSFIPHHERPEMASRTSGKAKPPANDMGFVSVANLRWFWAIEAKVIFSPGALAEYLKDVKGKFIPGRGSPLIGDGGMIGYLLRRNGEDTVFGNLAKQLDQTLHPFPRFEDRPHRASRHSRTGAPNLRLHHMMMACVEVRKRNGKKQ
uniref:Uncharacterized protein n=1 Tax=Candidatus Kentrum sp. SD TaxID=2126332 RepID=A0A451BMB5_9GAMM|nr:MAG: hypothetical protein BECKSD772D_GA0070982_10472 [Candidatus Kentron sp. SD]